MIGIKDLYTRYICRPLPEGCGIVCEPIDPVMAKLNRLLNDALSYFSYTLVLDGSAEIDYNGGRMSLSANDLFITTPGDKVLTLRVTDDFSALCLMVDETTIYEILDSRYAVLTAYSPALIHSQNKLRLTDNECGALNKWMKEIIAYGATDITYARPFLTALYSLFVCELMNIESRAGSDDLQYGRPSEIFLDFLKLLPANYSKHHNIQFYADRLAVTSIYLSRVVKSLSRQTVKNHIDRLRLSEASLLLKSTDKPVADIAGALNFANPQSFCKFFVRYKGVSPREYRRSNRSETQT